MHAQTFAASAFIAAMVAVPSVAQETDPSERPLPEDAAGRCIMADDIKAYHTISDELIRFELTGHDVIARLRKVCPQLHYHGYISYQPVNGMLCAKFDDVVSRSGMPCRIDSFTRIDHAPGDEKDEPLEKP